jgi:hypothetical protein
VFALIGLVSFWIDAAPRQENGTGHRMGRRVLLILGALVAATIYFRLRPGA